MAEDKSKAIDDDDEIIQIPDLDEQVEESTEQNNETVDDEETSPKADEKVLETETVTEKIVVRTSKDKKEKESKNKSEKKDKEIKNTDDKSDTPEASDKPESKIKKIWRKYLEKKKITIPLTIIAVIALLMAVPVTRYNILGLFIKQSVNVTVVDSKTGKPVSEADVTVAGISVKTDGTGAIQISGIKVGPQTVKVTKKYYQDTQADVLIPIRGSASAEFKIQATGRQVPVTVTNSINGKPIKDAVIKSGESSASTDANGQTVIVLSPDTEKEKAAISLNGYNNKDVEVMVVESQIDENKFTITPSGKIYFLSKKSGKIDVVKTNLDGSDRQTVLAGTGNEDDFNTSLLASRDWKYLALTAQRDDKQKVYLIDASNDQLTTIDEGNATFSPVGWYDNFFVFQVVRSDVQYWQAKHQALKSYNASSKFLKTIDETRAEGESDIDYAAESFGQFYILENEIVYAKTWSADYYSGGKIIGKNNSINSVRPDGSEKKAVKEFSATPGNNSYINAALYEPQEVYYQVTDYAQNVFYEYEDGKLNEAPTVKPDDFNKYYPTFLISPSGTKTFWHDPRDGKNTLFMGGKNAENEIEIAALSDYRPYGWFGDDYLLVSKNDSELYIATQPTIDKPLKITDYHKPNGGFSGYGYGYGGL